MPRPRLSIAQARLTGAVARNAGRYRDRAEPLVSEPLGDPPDYLNSDEINAWNEFRQRLPWLNLSHRGITHIASYLQARQASGMLGLPGMNLLRQCLGQMGATPATSRFAIVPDKPSTDPGEEFFR